MSNPYLGEIIMGGFNFAPRGWAFCDGQILAINANDALFSLLGTIYGGDGRTTFALPDLRSRVPVHFGSGPGLQPVFLGERGGNETSTLTSATMPSHSHSTTLKAENRTGNSDDPTNNMVAKLAGMYRPQIPAEDVVMHPDAVTASATGGSQSHENMPPFQVINFCIALVGVYPSRI